MFFFFNDTATTEIYTLSLHDALPIYEQVHRLPVHQPAQVHEPHDAVVVARGVVDRGVALELHRSEEHTSELQSRQYLVCRLLLEKKKNKPTILITHT